MMVGERMVGEEGRSGKWKIGKRGRMVGRRREGRKDDGRKKGRRKHMGVRMVGGRKDDERDWIQWTWYLC